jgi:hypothetical protein
MHVRRLVDTSPDVHAAVLVDAAGGLLASSDPDPERSRELADLTRQLVSQADHASAEPVEQIEVQVAGGSAYAVRSARHVLACVTRRGALSSLVLYDLRHALLDLERDR